MSNWQDLYQAPAAGSAVCPVDLVPDGGGHEVCFGVGKEPFRLLLLRRGPDLWAYHNSCPHFSLPLNFEPQHFIVLEGELVMCAHHTAFFRFDDGLCVDGPCAGAHLQQVPLRVSEGQVYIGE
jgi:nitrite reductase/ring-hydroxylating ferredoxin subunit